MSSSDAEILRLFTEPWENGEYEHVTGASWRPGQPAIELARCAWLHMIKTAQEDHLKGYTFESFLAVFVGGCDPAFL
jgi:hypothetical protein